MDQLTLFDELYFPLIMSKEDKEFLRSQLQKSDSRGYLKYDPGTRSLEIIVHDQKGEEQILFPDHDINYGDAANLVRDVGFIRHLDPDEPHQVQYYPQKLDS